MKFIEEHKQNIHQLLLRSDRYHNHLRIDNHQSNFDSIANFYGTIDLCSPITLIQFYQYPINSIGKKYDEYDVNHRACWWLVITDIIFIQKSVLTDILNELRQVEMTKKMETVKDTIQFGKVLRKMKDFWCFEDLIHEISKAVIFRVKKKVGVESMLDSVLKRAEYLENMVLREINEEQNEHNYYLNIIVSVIAMIQIVPLIHKMLDNIDFQNISFLGPQFGILFHVYVTFVISFILPLMIWRKLNKRKIFKRDVNNKKKEKPIIRR